MFYEKTFRFPFIKKLGLLSLKKVRYKIFVKVLSSGGVLKNVKM